MFKARLISSATLKVTDSPRLVASPDIGCIESLCVCYVYILYNILVKSLPKLGVKSKAHRQLIISKLSNFFAGKRIFELTMPFLYFECVNQTVNWYSLIFFILH